MHPSTKKAAHSRLTDYSSLVDVRLLKAHDSEEAACQEDLVRTDVWEEALAKGNSNEPNASGAENTGWAQWIPNKRMASASWFCKQANASLTGRSNGWTNPGPNQCMTNWAMDKYTAYRTANMNSTNWTPGNMNSTNWTKKMGNPGWTPHVTAIQTPCSSTLGTLISNPWSYRSPRLNLPWGPHQNKFVQQGGKFGYGK